MSLILTSKVNKKLEGYGKQMKGKGEIGGLTFGKFIDNGNIKIFDIMILNQIKTDMSFQIDDEDLMNITKNYSGKKLSQLIGWWHSHGNMFLSEFSPTDDNTFKRMSALSGICVGILINFDHRWKNMYIRGRVDTMTKLHGYISIDNVTPEIEQDLFFIKSTYFADDIKSKVKEDNRQAINCPRCRGMGFIYDFIDGFYKPKEFVKPIKSFDDEDDEDEDSGPYSKKLREKIYG